MANDNHKDNNSAVTPEQDIMYQCWCQFGYLASGPTNSGVGIKQYLLSLPSAILLISAGTMQPLNAPLITNSNKRNHPLVNKSLDTVLLALCGEC